MNSFFQRMLQPNTIYLGLCTEGHWKKPYFLLIQKVTWCPFQTVVENNCIYIYIFGSFFCSLVEKVLRIKPLAQLCLSFLMHNRGIQVHLFYSFSKNVNCPTSTFCCLFFSCALLKISVGSEEDQLWNWLMMSRWSWYLTAFAPHLLSSLQNLPHVSVSAIEEGSIELRTCQRLFTSNFRKTAKKREANIYIFFFPWVRLNASRYFNS